MNPLSVPVIHTEFDPDAFLGDILVSQDLCNFILTLALAYNDFKFYTIGQLNHLDSKPEGEQKLNSEWGEYAGVKLHYIRLHVAFANELLNLIKNNKKLLEDPFFKKVYKQLNKATKKSWDELVEVALSDDARPRKSNPLYKIRNKVIFHYDPEGLLAGYKKGFYENDKKKPACISIGGSLESSRLFFADLAVEGFLKREIDLKDEDYFEPLRKTLREINNSLIHLVNTFIITRGFSYQLPGISSF